MGNCCPDNGRPSSHNSSYCRRLVCISADIVDAFVQWSTTITQKPLNSWEAYFWHATSWLSRACMTYDVTIDVDVNRRGNWDLSVMSLSIHFYWCEWIWMRAKLHDLLTMYVLYLAALHRSGASAPPPPVNHRQRSLHRCNCVVRQQLRYTTLHTSTTPKNSGFSHRSVSATTAWESLTSHHPPILQRPAVK